MGLNISVLAHCRSIFFRAFSRFLGAVHRHVQRQMLHQCHCKLCAILVPSIHLIYFFVFIFKSNDKILARENRKKWFRISFSFGNKILHPVRHSWRSVFKYRISYWIFKYEFYFPFNKPFYNFIIIKKLVWFGASVFALVFFSQFDATATEPSVCVLLLSKCVTRWNKLRLRLSISFHFHLHSQKNKFQS